MDDRDTSPLTIMFVWRHQDASGPRAAELVAHVIGQRYDTFPGLLYALMASLEEASQDILLCDYDLCGHVYRIRVNHDGLLDGPRPVP